MRFKQLSVGRQIGEQARFKVVQGPDYGATYVITGPKALIGRGEENDVVISDLKASRVHAELSAIAGGWIVRDKGSANGILHNGRATREAKIVIGDTVTLGETTLEFSTSEAGTQMLVAPPRSMEQIQGDQASLNQRKKKLGAMGIFSGGDTSTSTPGTPAAQKNKRLLLLGGVAALGLLFFLGEDPPAKKSKKKGTDPKNLAAFLPDVPYNKEVDMIFKDGLREYFSKNYSRARTQFETVLQISPGHNLATLYLENCAKEVESEIKVHLEYGKKAFDAGKLRDARGHYARVMRLLHKDQSNPAYIESKEQLEKVNKVISGEIKGT